MRETPAEGRGGHQGMAGIECGSDKFTWNLPAAPCFLSRHAPFSVQRARNLRCARGVSPGAPLRGAVPAGMLCCTLEGLSRVQWPPTPLKKKRRKPNISPQSTGRKTKNWAPCVKNKQNPAKLRPKTQFCWARSVSLEFVFSGLS